MEAPGWKRMVRPWARPVTAVAALVALGTGPVGCDSDPLGPEPADSLLLPGPIRVTLDVAPDRLRPPGEVVVTLTYESLGSEAVVLGSPDSCMSGASVYRDGEIVPFPATRYVCLTVVSYWDLEPGDPISGSWTLSVGGEEGFEAPPGNYRFVADLHTHDYQLEGTFVIE